MDEGGTGLRYEKAWANTYNLEAVVPSLLLLEKVARRPDVEGTPCGIAVPKQTFGFQIPCCGCAI